jgi:predicted transposase YdaD
LSKIFVRGQKNDLSFTIDNRLIVLIEHQSTINENMPLRMLLYVTEVYQRTIDRKAILHKKKVEIPSPEFIVLYNGTEPCPDQVELKLSAAFKDTKNLKAREEGSKSLELVVRVYNINYGKNSEILKKCRTLNDYSFFIGKIREYGQKLPLEESIKAAIQYCIENSILKEFLDKYGTEVIKMILEDITVEDEIDAAREEGIEIGEARGEVRGEARGEKRVLDMVKQGISIDEIERQLNRI